MSIWLESCFEQIKKLTEGKLSIVVSVRLVERGVRLRLRQRSSPSAENANGWESGDSNSSSAAELMNDL